MVGTAETGTFGCPIVGSMNWTFGRYKDASRFWLSAEGTVQSITVYFASLGFSAKAAVYADFNGTPGILVVQSSNQSVGEVGWATFAVQDTAFVPGYYWLSVVCDDRSAMGMIVPASVNQHARKTGNFSSEFASDFGVPSGFDASMASIYASFRLAPTPEPMSPAGLMLPPGPKATLAPLAPIAVYYDPDCMVPASSIDWGTLYVGGSKDVTIYVRNEGSVPVTLSNSTTWYSATASGYMTLNWNYKSQELAASSVMKIVLTLAVASDIPATVKDFSFDLTITATG